MDNLRPQMSRLPQVICEKHPEWVTLFNTAWRMGFENLEYPAQPGWKPQLTCMPGRGCLWQWDSCFMTLFARYSNGQLPGMNNLDNLYRLQRDDGFMAMAYEMDSGRPAYGERINPPLFAWAEWEYFRVTGDASRFESVLPRLVRYFDWIKTNRTRASGLYWFEDSGSSGMDNSPRSGWLSEKLNGSDVCFIDLACQQALSATYIQKIAQYMDQAGLVDRFGQEHDALRQLINGYHWSEKVGLYFDLFSRDWKDARHNFLNHKTLASFWPLISKVANEGQVGRLMEHLVNPNEFWTPHPLPTLSKDDPNYDPLGGYWLGGVWAPTNYMVAAGLKKFQKHDLAREIAVRHLNAMVEVMRSETYDSIWECYSPEYPRPGTDGYGHGALVRSDFVGWTGLGPIAMLIEHIFGFDFDAKENRITWVIGTEGVHGVENLTFNHKTLSCLCHGKNPSTGKVRICVESSGDIKLVLMILGKCIQHSFSLKSGKHDLVF
ncbi:MAG: trehalase family glycosidase [Phycisphaerae bacterium]